MRQHPETLITESILQIVRVEILGSHTVVVLKLMTLVSDEHDIRLKQFHPVRGRLHGRHAAAERWWSV